MTPPKPPGRGQDVIGVLSTAQFARALGVSESSIKRWADDGALRVVRTRGGHRRIPLAEAVRFVRESNATLVHPAALGLGRGQVAARSASGLTEQDQLLRCLTDGGAAETCGFLDELYLRGRSVAAIIDGPLRTAMERIGERWHHAPDGILVEHRATDICIRWVNHIRSVLAPGDDAPVAIGAAPPGDPYVLPTLAVAAAFESEGVRAINLGPDTPVETTILALERERPAVVWVSVSNEAGRAALAGALGALCAAARRHGSRLILGGRALAAAPLEVPPEVQVYQSLGEVAAFARGLIAGSRR